MFNKIVFVFLFLGVVLIHFHVFGNELDGVAKKESVVELVFTQDELFEMGKWKDKTF